MKTFLKKTIALACFAMLMPLSLLAQDVLKVHGIVTDPSGEPLIGVNVRLVRANRMLLLIWMESIPSKFLLNLRLPFLM